MNMENKLANSIADYVEEEVLSDSNETNEYSTTKPFDPSKIDVNIETVNMGSLIDQLENDEIELQPEFQRAADLWNSTQKSRLIESILLGLPLPSFYFSEDAVTQKRSIIDGLQRLCAIKDFIIKKDFPLALCNLQFLKSLEGKTYNDLERPEKRRINSLKITLNTLRKGTPTDVKYIIFQRVNTAGNPLKPQEMRHALNQGIPARFIKELSDLESFKQATNYCVSNLRMQDRDLVTRFIGFYLEYDLYTDELDSFLNDAMGRLRDKNSEELQQIKKAFDSSMSLCYELFGNDAFRKRLKKEDDRKAISKSIFDTVSVNIAWLSTLDQNLLVARKDDFKEKLIVLFNDKAFSAAISIGTSKKSSVEKRFSEIKKLIQEVISYD